jgi:two-component system, chemotaxis family, protein-glutamate methylesterase/glutaminase
VVRGPKENGFRPAVDPLFRTAAASYGNRVTGIVLSGILDDGTQGLREIKRAHGATIVQNPQEASQADMPRSAIERVGVDYVLLANQIGPLVNLLANDEIELTMSQPATQIDVAEGVVDALRLRGLTQPPAPLTCPDCGGALWEVDDDDMLRYRCHVGHGYTADSLHSVQDSEAEQMLWSAVRIIEEQAELQRRLASRWEEKANYSLQKRFEANAQERERTADFLRSIVIQSPQVVDRPAPTGAESNNVLRQYGT